MLFEATWIQLEIIVLSQRKTSPIWYHLYMESKIWHKSTYLWSKNRIMDKENKLNSVQFSHSVVFNSLWPHGLHHAGPPCSSPTPEAYSNSRPSSRWCHPTILSSVIPFSSRPQSFPASGSSPMSQFFASGGQSIGVSASASVLPMNIQDRFPENRLMVAKLGWVCWLEGNGMEGWGYQMQAIIYRMDKQWDPIVQQRELYLISYDKP